MRLPQGVYPVFGLFGYPDQDPEIKPRLPVPVVVKQDYYNEEGDVDRIEEYDEVIREYYRTRTGGGHGSAGEQVATLLSEKSRPHMKAFLADQASFLNSSGPGKPTGLLSLIQSVASWSQSRYFLADRILFQEAFPLFLSFQFNGFEGGIAPGPKANLNSPLTKPRRSSAGTTEQCNMRKAGGLREWQDKVIVHPPRVVGEANIDPLAFCGIQAVEQAYIDPKAHGDHAEGPSGQNHLWKSDVGVRMPWLC